MGKRRRLFDRDWEHLEHLADLAYEHGTRGFRYQSNGIGGQIQTPLKGPEPRRTKRLPGTGSYEDYVARGWLRIYQAPGGGTDIWVQHRLLRVLWWRQICRHLFGGSPLWAFLLGVLGTLVGAALVEVVKIVVGRILGHP